jgi:hypothetical protein
VENQCGKWSEINMQKDFFNTESGEVSWLKIASKASWTHCAIWRLPTLKIRCLSLLIFISLACSTWWVLNPLVSLAKLNCQLRYSEESHEILVLSLENKYGFLATRWISFHFVVHLIFLTVEYFQTFIY